MKTLLLLVALAITVSAQPRNELERALAATTRTVYEVPVDITPYVKWRKEQKGDRPMTAWYYMTGKIVRVIGYEWEMEVYLDGFGEPQKIIMRNPPRAALNEFTALSQQYGSLKAEAEQSSAVADAAYSVDETARANAIATPLPEFDPSSRKRTVQSQANFDNAIATRQQTRANNVLASERARLASQAFRNFDPNGYKIPGEFQFKGYAVKTREKHASGLPLFDHGRYH